MLDCQLKLVKKVLIYVPRMKCLQFIQLTMRKQQRCSRGHRRKEKGETEEGREVDIYEFGKANPVDKEELKCREAGYKMAALI